MKMPQVILADDLKDWDVESSLDGSVCTLSRPLALFSILVRFRLAIGVFTGKYDALKWGQGQ